MEVAGSLGFGVGRDLRGVVGRKTTEPSLPWLVIAGSGKDEMTEQIERHQPARQRAHQSGGVGGRTSWSERCPEPHTPLWGMEVAGTALLPAP